MPFRYTFLAQMRAHSHRLAFGRDEVAVQWRWVRLAVTWQEERPLRLWYLPRANGNKLLNPDLCGNIHDRGGYVPAQVAAWHTFTGRSARDQRGDAISRPASGFDGVIWGALRTSYRTAVP